MGDALSIAIQGPNDGEKTKSKSKCLESKALQEM
jgi:hypothetical protein